LSEQIFIHRVVGPLQCNCYVVGDPATREAIVIDPGGDADALVEEIAAQKLLVTAIVATHAHFDHVLAAARLRELTGASFHMHAEDRPLLAWMRESGYLFLGVDLGDPPEVDTEISEDDDLRAGGAALRVIHTPGHSPGSISLLGGSNLFAGDTLFAGSVGRYDLPGGDGDALARSIRMRLFPLPDDMPVHPGHGPSTTIARERATNPFVGEGRDGGL
jgi:glyoxylase-like metal-dependent hydrolase (beta-lactamase superfamily II)